MRFFKKNKNPGRLCLSGLLSYIQFCFNLHCHLLTRSHMHAAIVIAHVKYIVASIFCVMHHGVSNVRAPTMQAVATPARKAFSLRSAMSFAVNNSHALNTAKTIIFTKGYPACASLNATPIKHVLITALNHFSFILFLLFWTLQLSVTVCSLRYNGKNKKLPGISV